MILEFPKPLYEGIFIKRYKRFFADVELNGEVITTHCPNTGSMKGLLEPGCPALIHDTKDPKRKLKFGLKALKPGSSWVGVDTHMPNKFVEKAILEGKIESLQNLSELKREVKIAEGTRIDLVAKAKWGRCLIEVKNVTLIDNSMALFPDSVSSRGLKHLNHLIDFKKRGDRCAMVYLIQRGDAQNFKPAAEIDPDYANAFYKAVENGVEIYPIRCKVSAKGIEFDKLLEF